ncbi:MAG TPA: B12-binding domain-containing radical SAM protein [Longimicrobiaceae bacterium]|nr:B12-binding domain-containing radical SAM protein [Longimicrobiaceae bacterium]
MCTTVVVSFDLIRPGEPPVSLAIGSLLANCADRPHAELEIRHVSINLLEVEGEAAVDLAEARVLDANLSQEDVVAISAYVWSEPLTQSLIRRLRGRGFAGTIVLGGYQVSYAAKEELPALYPGVDVFITGYGEAALRKALSAPRCTGYPLVLEEPVTFEELQSPYLTGAIPVAMGQQMVRLESKRGCPFRCSFCAHRDLRGNRVHRYSIDRVREELRFMRDHGVGKINFVDPVFNQGPDYLPLMEYMVEIGLESQIALQSRFELIRGDEGERFLELATELGAHLEFGLQTAMEDEGRHINRRNRMAAVADVMRALARRGISYEVSLIYGLPGQTLASFEQSIHFVRDNGCERVVAWPLMLLRGTELFSQREKWQFRERAQGGFGIPVVYESSSFDEREWLAMKSVAEGLAPHTRV